MRRVEYAIKQLRSRAEDFYVDEKGPDGDFLNQIANLFEEVILPSHPEHTQDV
jgi:hypothetical protein